SGLASSIGHLRISFSVYLASGQSPASALEPIFQLCHEGLALQARRNRRQEFQGDGAGLLDEAAPAPEQAGVEGDGNDRQVEVAIKRGHAGLIGAVLTGGDPRSLGEDQKIATLLAPALRA